MDGTLGYCPQDVILNMALTVDQHLDYFRAAYGVTNLRRADELVERLGYARYRSSVVGTLSGGTRQKLNLSLALMHDPDILLLDEPYQGFDWETYLRFWDLAAELRDRGRSVVVISHLLFDQRRFDALYKLESGCLRPFPIEDH
jgi:ABC-2 type transport system ATP-binding protein